MSDLILLDSHAWFWWINLEHERLSETMLKAITVSQRVGVSAVSCYELALAHKRGRLQLPMPANQWFNFALKGSGIDLLALSPVIAQRAVSLSAIHRDPFDRIIIATALEKGAKLISLDGLFSNYPELSHILLA
ncbi:MAG: PIN domain-containing protein [Gammaproteobacteria bacterium SHHR-1]